MSTIIQRLQRDHVNLARLLDVLEGQLATFHDGGSPDYDVIEDAMHYMTHYPDQTHHPLEDAVFERLIRRDPEAAGLVEALHGEHRILFDMGAQFLRTLEAALSESLFEREALDSEARAYVAFHRAHVQREEAQAFPRALKSLDETDWAALEAVNPPQVDPLFGETVAEEYRDLADEIAALSG